MASYFMRKIIHFFTISCYMTTALISQCISMIWFYCLGSINSRVSEQGFTRVADYTIGWSGSEIQTLCREAGSDDVTVRIHDLCVSM